MDEMNGFLECASAVEWEGVKDTLTKPIARSHSPEIPIPSHTGAFDGSPSVHSYYPTQPSFLASLISGVHNATFVFPHDFGVYRKSADHVQTVLGTLIHFPLSLAWVQDADRSNHRHGLTPQLLPPPIPWRLQNSRLENPQGRKTSCSTL